MDIINLRGSMERYMEQRHQDQQRKADGDRGAFTTSSMMSNLLDPPSNFVPSGASSPTPGQSTSTSFLAPKRPKSTPFPYLSRNHARSTTYPAEGSDSACDWRMGDDDADSDTTFFDSVHGPTPTTGLCDLPVEVQEGILDHLFGYRVSTTSISAMKVSSMRGKSWGTAMRHSRRKELTELALVSSTWRTLVQQRLYRHIKLKGTVDFLEDAMLHFTRHEHLRSSVRHIEIWFPVFQPTYRTTATSSALALLTVTTDGLTNATYTLPRDKCTLEEVFRFVSSTLPGVQILTLEGGERRKAPKVAHFHDHGPDSTIWPRLASLASVQTLITRGQWNLTRDDRDFGTVFDALPNLTRWCGSYSKPKSKSYMTVSQFLPYLPRHVTNLELCLESDYRRETGMPPFFRKALERTHICSSLAEVLPSLEHFSYTGRICHAVFDRAVQFSDPRNTNVKAIDLTVKNCCRPLAKLMDSGSGVQDMGFIDAFERLVLAAIRSLAVLKQVQYIRIRFVDLESVLPPLNPFFLFENNKCSGVWSEEIIAEMGRARPQATWPEISDSFGNIVYNKEGRMVISPEEPGKKITSLKLSNYRLLSHRIIIN